MKTTQYKLLRKSCDGKTLPGSAWRLECGGEGRCPAIIEEGNAILVIGKKVSKAYARELVASGGGRLLAC